MILERQSNRFEEFDIQSYVMVKDLLKLFDKNDQFKDDLIKVYKLEDEKQVLHIGNAKNLLNAISTLDALCEKKDIDVEIRNVHLHRMLDSEKAVFDVFDIKDKFVLLKNGSDMLRAETRYNAKHDILDYYHFSKFANYCRDKKHTSLINYIRDYLINVSKDNDKEWSLRLLYVYEDNKFYIRAQTSKSAYKDFGINFSVFVAIMSLHVYSQNQKSDIYINSYGVDDSDLYVSFTFSKSYKVSTNLSLSISLILENNEIKKGAVSFSGLVEFTYKDKDRSSKILLKPTSYRRGNTSSFNSDILTYEHRGNVDNVFEKLQDLPKLIDFFIEQVKEDAALINKIDHPDDVRKLIFDKIRKSKKPEFQDYKGKVMNALARITVDTTFKLFEQLRKVEDLFEHDDVVSQNFWRTKLYEALIKKGKDY